MSIESDLIVKHALANRESLAIAIKVGLAFPSLKQTIYTDFLRRLAAEVKEAIGVEWNVSTNMESGLALYIRRHAWPEEAFIGLFSDSKTGKDVYFSVGRFVDLFQDPIAPDRGFEEQLRADLDEKIGKGAASNNCAWWKYVSRYRDLDAEEALLAISGGEAVEYYKTPLVQICHVVSLAFSKQRSG